MKETTNIRINNRDLIRIYKASALAILILFATFGCSDISHTQPQLKHRLIVGDRVLSLKDANLFLSKMDNCGGQHDRRYYFISDGELIDGQPGVALDQYTNATYYVQITLGVPCFTWADFTAKDFAQYSDWYNTSLSSTNIAYIEMEKDNGSNAYINAYTNDVNTDPALVKVTGGFDNGEIMTLAFEGKLDFVYFNGTDWITEPVDSKLIFSGVIIDKR
jgi:hypothetical protein